MTPAASLAVAWGCAAVAMAAGWGWQRRHANAGIVDVIWAAGVGAGAAMLAALGSGAGGSRIMLALLGGAWGLRLARHLWLRVRGEPEDGRYRHLRAHWQGSQAKFFLFFQFQALLVALFALPFAAVAANAAPSAAWATAGLAIWFVAVAGETLADRQLARFRAVAANRGKVMERGLWAWSRHPNYFFEWLHWFAYVALAVGSPLWWLSWSGPLVMYAFLRWISGVPHTEAQALRSRGAAYRDYQRRTPMLFPRFPRKDSTWTP
jgi:steroid 5-alpha reductase family enzyme